jgi:hypothetical protein
LVDYYGAPKKSLEASMFEKIFTCLLLSLLHSSRSLVPAMQIRAEANSANLTPSERQRVIDAVVQNVQQHYFDSEVAQKIKAELLRREKNGEYNSIAKGETFANLLTKEMRAVSHDMHLEVVSSEEPLPDGPREPTPEMIERFHKQLLEANCEIRQVNVLAHNIGYLKLDAFPDVSVCQSKVASAMASLNHADAMIFDLRDNGGGDWRMVSFIAGYLFDHPEFLYDPRANPTLQSWTQPRAGNRLSNKPVYVLTSHSTISAAEQFTYDLKMLKRVMVVGETTHGSAHAGVFYRLDDHFGMGIPRLKAINPFSKTDWEGIGVAPDVAVPSDDALEAAQKIAQNEVRER